MLRRLPLLLILASCSPEPIAPDVGPPPSRDAVLSFVAGRFGDAPASEAAPGSYRPLLGTQLRFAWRVVVTLPDTAPAECFFLGDTCVAVATPYRDGSREVMVATEYHGGGLPAL